MSKRARTAAIVVALAVLLVADIVAIAWLDSHEVEVIGIAACLLLFVWLGVVLSDPTIEWPASQ